MNSKQEKLLFWQQKALTHPLVIAHRGACAHALENTTEAFTKAYELGSDMWEIDVRLSADGECVVCHDADLGKVAGNNLVIADTPWEQLSGVVLNNGEHLLHLDEVIELAQQLDAGLYIELKAQAGKKVLEALNAKSFDQGIIGSFEENWIHELAEQDCPYPLSTLVRVGRNPFEQAKRAKADMIHLCWEHASPEPYRLLTDEFMERARTEKLPVVLWHEERPEIIKHLVNKPVLGICSDTPERFKVGIQPKIFQF